MHGILPHSPMHAASLADTVTVTDSQTGTKCQLVVQVRETRITGVLIHTILLAVTLTIPQLVEWIPIGVQCGLFLFCATSTLINNSLYERITLIFMEQVGQFVYYRPVRC